MATTAQMLLSETGVSLFYYLKITGIPYYFFCAQNPTDTSFGASAWTLPAGYTAVRGMDLPTDTLEQKMGDMIGGIATAERIRLTLRDFDVTDTVGTLGSYRYLSRLFSPGRMSAAGVLPELSTQINVTDGAFASFDVINLQAGLGAGIVHIGGEAIQITGSNAPTTGHATCTIATGGRNKYPCSANYPPPLLHRVVNADGILAGSILGNTNAGRNQRVTTEPYTLIGRTAAFYVGHMQPGGLPCLESETLLRTLGRITSIDIGKAGGSYELQVQSILADAANALVAPGFKTYDLRLNQICLAQDAYCSFEIGFSTNSNALFGNGRSVFKITVPQAVYYSPYTLASVIQILLNAIPDASTQGLTPSIGVENVDGALRFVFRGKCTVWTSGESIHTSTNGNDIYMFVRNFVSPFRASVGLLTALGFGVGTQMFVSNLPQMGSFADHVITAPNAAPSIFYPLGFDSGSVGSLQTVDPNAVFTGTVGGDQGDGGSAAFARLGSGQMARVVASSPPYSATGQVVLGGRPSYLLYGVPMYEGKGPEDSYFYVPCNDTSTATITQIWLSPPNTSVLGDPPNMLGRILASTGLNYGGTGLDCYPQGIGLGWGNILDTASVMAIGGGDVPRAAVIDATTKFVDLFAPIAKEYGLFLLWDPLQGKIAIRKVTMPSSPFAALPALSESNRVTVNDRTEQKIDQSALRSAWTLKWGWSNIQDKFLAPDMTYNDVEVASSYGGSVKGEKIEDKTLSGLSAVTAGAVLGLILARSYLYRQPWLKCKRTLTKAGLLLAPGSVHNIVDNTIVNPFTGAPGITAADGLYALLTSVSANPATGACTVEFVINRLDRSNMFRAISPCALLDFAATGNGYSNGVGTVTLVNHFASDGVSYDGIDFTVGDAVTLISYNADQAPTYQHNTTITAVAIDGHTVSVASGLGAIASEEVIMILQHYGAATAARQTTIAFQGDESGDIEGTTPNHKFS